MKEMWREGWFCRQGTSSRLLTLRKTEENERGGKIGKQKKRGERKRQKREKMKAKTTMTMKVVANA